MNASKIEALLQQAMEQQNIGSEQEAIKIFRKVLEEDENQPDALQFLGQIAQNHRNFDIARDLFLKSLESNPDQFHVWALYGKILYDLRQVKEAEKAMLKALELNPDYAQANMFLANFALNRGDNDQAVDFATKALAINPRMQNVYLIMARARTIAPDDPLVKKMHALVLELEDQPRQSAHLHFALSYVYEASGETDKFFNHLRQGNEQFREPDEDRRVKIDKKFKKIKETMTPEFLARKVGIENKRYTPVFIVGMPRSGTTLLDQIFATHSQCFGGDELLYFPKYLNRITAAKTEKKNEEGYGDLKIGPLTQVAQLYQRRVQEIASKALFISDKMPWNFHLVGMISVILPWAKIIHIHRDPLDCGWSTYRNPLDKKIWFSTGMEPYAWYRKKYQDLMDFWQMTIPDKFINVAYEDLVKNPEEEIIRVMDYCGLPYEDNLLNFHQTKREVHTMSSGQVNKPIHQRSVGSAAKYAKQLEPMKIALKKYKLG